MCIDCDSCYEMDYIACYSQVSFIAGLTPITEYTIFVRDRHGNFFTQEVVTDADGNFELDTTLFPEGMFNQYSGTYEISASLSPLFTTSETMTIGYEEFNCIKINFHNVE